jgi:hypothetical protein
MTDEVVEVTIRPSGAVEMHVDGVAGRACLSATEELVRLLGGDVEVRELTVGACLDGKQRQQDLLWC